MTLRFTETEVTATELLYIGVEGRPNRWWPGPTGNDCVGFQTFALGLRSGHETYGQLDAHPEWISIAAFRAHYQWPEIHPNAIRPGDLVCYNFTGTRLSDGVLEAEHMERAYSTDLGVPSMVIIGANTGPVPGTPTPNGVHKKTRVIDGNVLFGIRPPYAEPVASRARKHEVATVAAFVNAQVKDPITRTTADQPGKDYGMEGRNYWRLVQTWGRHHGYYGSTFVIDGIPGPQSRLVEAAAFKAATAKH